MSGQTFIGFNAAMKIIKLHAGRKEKLNEDSFKSEIKEKEDILEVTNFPNECSHSKTEESLELGNAPWEYDGEFLDVSAICGNCDKKSKTVDSIEFEQTEGREE